MLTDVTIRVDCQQFDAHKAVLVACSGFFYSVFMDPDNANLRSITLDSRVDPKSFSILLDFMYTSCLNLNDSHILATLNAALYLQMEHVADTCHRFVKARNSSSQLEDDTQAETSEVFKKSEEHRSFGPNVFRGINTSNSYQVYNDHSVSESSSKMSLLPRTSAFSPTLNSNTSPIKFQNFSSIIRLSGSFQEPATPIEEDNVHHPQAKCRLSPVYNKPLICSPQSPLRSDGQPNSPTESSSSKNALLSLKEHCPKESKAHNWKKFILMNQSLDDKDAQEANSGGDSPTHSPLNHNSSGHHEGLSEDGHSDQKDELTHSSCSSLSCDSPQRLSPDLASNDDTLRLHSEYANCEKNTYLCNGCDSQFSEGESAGERSGGAHGDKPYKCDCCQASFRYKGNLASHKTVHTGAKPYHCNICGAQFNRPANLKTHTRIHSGEKPYKCETCGSRFVQVAHLRAHVLIHTGEKPYPCEICGTHFRHLQTLKSHMRIHTGEKPYHCENCDLHFRHKSQLRLHLRQKHGAVTNTKAQYRRGNSSLVTSLAKTS